MLKPLEVLKKYWKYDSFKEPQDTIIDHVLNNKDVISILPTGGGKSLCYQIPALIKDGVCLVISPLIALMNDQVENLKRKGIKAIAITSLMNKEDAIREFDNLQYGNYKFLYLSPEKLQSEFIQEKISQLQLILIAIDEAHCISEWGHDFRPAYLKIPILKNLFPNVSFIALTATATERVLNDIKKNLLLNDSITIKKSLVRDNLSLQVINTEDLYYHLKRILAKNIGPAIVYINSRKKVKEYSNYLNKQGFKSSYYHGGLSNNEKLEAFNNWMEEKTPVMVATNAFGMGIDKNNVKTIIHLDLPSSLENYMQEAGRAGRNGKDAFSYVFYSNAAVKFLKRQHRNNTLTLPFIKTVYKNLNQYLQIAYGELPKETYSFNLNTFCKHYSLDLVPTYNTLKFLEKENILSFDENLNKRSTLKFITSPNNVLNYSEKNHSDLIKVVLRSYGGIFENHVAINEVSLSKRLNITEKYIKDNLTKLANDGLVDYHYNKNKSRILFLVPREDDNTINVFSDHIKLFNKVKQEKMASVINYAQNTLVCRSKFLLQYFGETNTYDCGICDVCLNKKSISTDYKSLSEKIIALLITHKQLSSKTLVELLTNADTSKVLTTLQLLLDTNKITINSQHKFEIK